MEKKLIIKFIALFVAIQGISQSAQISREYKWTEYYNKNGVLIEYKYEECNLPHEGYYRENVLLRLTNKNTYDVTVDWDIVTWYGTRCNNCDFSNPEQHRSVAVKAGSSFEATCRLDEFSQLKLFSKFLNYDMPDAELTNFQLANIKVKQS